MKKTVIILLSIIIIFSIILTYKITSSKNEYIDIANANIYDEDVYDTDSTYYDNFKQENQIIVKKQPSSNDNQSIKTEEVTPEQEQLKQQKQQLSQDSSSNYNNYQTTPKLALQILKKKIKQ